jgi:peptide deformylase
MPVILTLTQFGNPVLRKAAKPVTKRFINSPQCKTLIEDMFRTMHSVSGIGLAASQIGESIQLAVIQLEAGPSRPNLKTSDRIVIINPKITRSSKEMTSDWEGCLSFDGVRGRVPRPREITVRYLNQKGEKVTRKVRGLLARAFQHEIDHLNGTVYIDRVRDTKTIMTYEEFLKRVVR